MQLIKTSPLFVAVIASMCSLCRKFSLSKERVAIGDIGGEIDAKILHF